MRKIETQEIACPSGKCYSVNVYPADMRFNDFIPGVIVLFNEDKTLFITHSDNVDYYLQKNKVSSLFADKGLTAIGLIKNASKAVREAAIAELNTLLSPSVSELPVV